MFQFRGHVVDEVPERETNHLGLHQVTAYCVVIIPDPNEPNKTVAIRQIRNNATEKSCQCSDS
jgi:hypothetical protein